MQLTSKDGLELRCYVVVWVRGCVVVWLCGCVVAFYLLILFLDFLVSLLTL